MREQLLDRMIQVYGFGHPAVIRFAKLVERGVSVGTLQTIFESYERMGLAFDWKEEEED